MGSTIQTPLTPAYAPLDAGGSATAPAGAASGGALAPVTTLDAPQGAAAQDADSGDNPLTDSNGAPRIDATAMSFDVSTMAAMLSVLQNKTQSQQLKAAQSGVEAKNVQMKANNDKQMGKIKDWIKKCEQAKHKSLLGKIFGWVGKIVAVIASVVAVAVAGVATVATGGAAAPLLAIALVGAMAATMSLASAASQANGGPEISVGSLIKATVGKFLVNVCGVDQKTADEVCGVAGGALALACPVMVAIDPSLVGGAAQSIAQMAGASSQTAGYIGMGFGLAATIGVGIAMAVMSGGASVGESVGEIGSEVTAQTLKNVDTVMQTGSTVAQGAAGVGQGVTTIQQGQLQKQADDAQADRKDLQALALKLQQQVQNDTDDLKEIMQAIDASTQLISKMMSGAADSMQQIAMNMTGKAMA